MNDYDYSLKYIVVGDSGVGKSNIVQRFIDNKFNGFFYSTIGVEFHVKTQKYNNLRYKIQLWDTAGQETFRTITKLYYRNTCVVFLVFSYDNKESFAHLEEWLEDIYQNVSNKNVLVYIIGNKIDVNTYSIEKETATEFAKNKGLKYFDVSAKTGEGITELFNTSIDDISILVKNKQLTDLAGIKKPYLEEIPEKERKCCVIS